MIKTKCIWNTLSKAFSTGVACLCAIALTAQNPTVTGTVSEESGDPLPNVAVTLKGSTQGVTSGVDGKYSIAVPDAGAAVLVFSCVGFSTQEVAVGSRTAVNVVMIEAAQEIDEIVVVGYNTSQRRESLTGSLQTLKSEKLVTVTTPSVENMLSGKVPGVYVAPGDGRPGSRGSVIIRGKSSINGTVDPLWVVDGVIVGSASNYTLNPNDIESMTILKDAASTAIYGSQGANGVIVVTTKRALAGKMNVAASAKIGFNSLHNGNLEVMNGAELYDYFKSFANAEAVAFPRWNEQLRNANYDWWKLATRTGLTQDYNVSIAGGTDKVKSYFSVNYYNEEGAVRGYGFNRYGFRYRSEFKPIDRVTIKPMISGSLRKTDDRQYSVTAMYSNLPWDSPYLPDGSPTPHKSSTWVNSNSTNYLYDLQWNKAGDSRYSFAGNLDFDVKIIDGLIFSSVNSINWDGYFYSAYTDPRSNDGSGVNGRLREYNTTTMRRYTNQILRYTKTFGHHSLNVLAAYEFNDYRYKTVDAIGTSFIAGFEVLDVTAKPEKTAGLIEESAVQSLLSNIHYSYDDKYLFQFSLRRDGASNFGPEAKYGTFFSLSGGWLLHKERFLRAEWINTLKLRVAYGSVGNRPSSMYPQYDLYGVSGSYDEIAGALISQIGNRKLTWETTYTLGFGLDFNFLDRFRLSLDYYNRNTDNILFQVPVTGIIGVTRIWRNVGELENNGFEASLGVDILRAKDWQWSFDLNVGLNRNKLKKLYGNLEQHIDSNIGGPAGSINRILKPGYSIDTWYTREWAGVNPENGAPQWYATDENGARVVTDTYSKANEVICGSYNPDFYGGFSTSLSWRQFDLNAVFGYSVGGTIYNYSRQEYDSDGTYTDRNQMKLMKDWNRWEKPGDIATHPKPSYNNSSLANSVSSRFLENADYLKLRSLSIGYSLPAKSIGFETLRFSFSAENLLTITKYSGVDPEIPTYDGHVRGVTGAAAYPVTRKFMFSINFSL
jgi:TonB-linked SusC/RagA family outer membrane protein